MLPDYRELKAEVGEWLQQVMRARLAFHSGFVGTIPKVRVFEGSRTVVGRPGGEDAPNEMESVEISHLVPDAEVDNMTIADVLRHIDEMAQKMAKESVGRTYKQIDETVEAAGQVVEGKPGRMHEAILAAFEAMDLSFDPDGKHHQLTLVVHPAQSEAVASALRALEEDPALKPIYDALIERKREEWRGREASRRLVG